MFDDIATLFHENVVESFQSYREARRSPKAGRSRDLRLALSAATALYHFREHLPASYTKSRTGIVKQCPDYDLLGDVVNAAKHGDLTRGSPQLVSADQIEERILVTEYEDEQGVYRHTEKQVVLKLAAGVERDLEEVLVNVINFWQDELSSLGVIEKRAGRKAPQTPQPRARAECNGGRIDFESIQGVRFQQTFCVRRFNYKTGTIEPVDLSGSELRFSIYKPRFDADVVLRNDTTGRELLRTISLSDEESQELLKQPTDGQKQQYLARLPQGQQAIAELLEEVRRLQASSEGEQPPSAHSAP